MSSSEGCFRFGVVYSFAGRGYLGACLEWGVNFCPCFVVNVYAKCSLADQKVMMWDHLVHTYQWFPNDAWCALGNFNEVPFLNERKGMGVGAQSLALVESLELKAFIEVMKLVDLPF